MPALNSSRPKTLAVMSHGLWRLRGDLKQLFPYASLVRSRFGLVDGYVGWGNRPSGMKARRLAATNYKDMALLEGGFLHGFFAGRIEPPASYILDDVGVHYDSTAPSSLETLIAAGIDDSVFLSRAKASIEELRAQKLSKYNSSPILSIGEAGVSENKPYVLLIDQVPHDASIAGAQANSSSFAAMLKEAVTAWPDHQIVVRPHLASRAVGHLQEACTAYPETIILQKTCNIWPLLEQADHVYTVSSHVGFEALFCGTPVTCFGFPFYAGWGLTNDMLPPDQIPRRGMKRSLETVFAAAYLQCSRYLDVHDRKITTLENSIDTLATIVKSRARNQSMVATAGLSRWKRRAVSPFLISQSGKPKHFSSVTDAQNAVRSNDGGIVAVWGNKHIPDEPGGEASSKVFRLEDGFVRSVGLGAELRFPLSLVRDTQEHLYYDSRGPGMIEDFLKRRPFDEELLTRAERLIALIVEKKLTKYQLNQGELSTGFHKKSNPGALKILVTGQVEDDASIRFSTTDVRTNTDLLAAVRKLYPDATIAYREHPDVANNLRPGKADRSFVDLDADIASLPDLLDWCDRLETLTSLTGMEALLRRKPVGTHGTPFYSGWGLTDDRSGQKRRGKATLEELVAATFLLYPDYIHPDSGLPCSAERLIEALAEPRPVPLLYRAVLYPSGKLAGRLKHRFIRSKERSV